MKKVMNKIKLEQMRSFITLSKSLLLAISLVVFLSCANDDKQTVVNFTELVMADEFDTDGAPDSSIWDYDIGNGFDGWGNNELQYYTDRADNISVQNGVLLITAKKEQFNSSSYTSARIITKGLFEQQYGRFEARIRIPYGQGMWPAFWLLGSDCDGVGENQESNWPDCGEIDIMEIQGQRPNIVYGAVHGPGYSGFDGNPIFKGYTLENDRFDTGFHVFGIEWGPDYINYYVDDILYNQITPADVSEVTGDSSDWVFNKPFYIVINLAVGGTFGGTPNAETVFPQSMLVDYVRVYKNN